MPNVSKNEKRAKLTDRAQEESGSSSNMSDVTTDNEEEEVYDEEDEDEEYDVETERMFYDVDIVSSFVVPILDLLMYGVNSSIGPSVAPLSTASSSHNEETCSHCIEQKRREQGLLYPENIGGVPTYNHYDSSARMGWRIASLCVIAVMVDLITEHRVVRSGELSNIQKKKKDLCDLLILDPSAFFIKCLSLFRNGIKDRTIVFNDKHIFVRGYLNSFANDRVEGERERCEIASCPPCLRVLPYIKHL
jgi:hypothetical protein